MFDVLSELLWIKGDGDLRSGKLLNYQLCYKWSSLKH